MQQADKWKWRIEPFDSRLGYYICISAGMTIYGPDGGPFLSFGSSKRAIKKAKRIIRKLESKEQRRKQLTQRSSDGAGPIA